MLYHLYVKDLALIESSEVEFGEGLNILTGETGAGKSILIGSINLCLGSKANKDMIRNGKEYGFVEIVFGGLTEEQEAFMRSLDIEPEDGQIIIRRKISTTRSEIKINDETVTLAKLRKVAEQLIDIHGQHEHQSLLRDGYHLKVLDDFQQKETGSLRLSVSGKYREYVQLKEKLDSFNMDESQRQRELDFLKFEIEDIENAELKEGEEEELAQRYKKYQNIQKIYGSVQKARAVLDQVDLSSAIKSIQDALGYDDSLQNISDSLYDLQTISEDTVRELDHYLDKNDFDEEDFQEVTERLDYIRGVMAKYGGTVDKTEKALVEKQERLKLLEDYDEERSKCEKTLDKTKSELLKLCSELTNARKKGAKVLAERIRTEMTEMGFLDVKFELAFTELSEPGSNGIDEVHFVVSLNPGEPLRPLSDVASGGELSRIMLSIKTVLADTDEISTLIFDEIDTGISGRTAEKVSEKLKKISMSHQVILITHLPQIAAKADEHFCIEKLAESGHTHTNIRRLDEDESVMELARLLAGGRVTDAVLANARELKSLAKGASKEV
ncbi:DNA repair protein RecN [Oribacterium sp. WCC10]|uniref:DNA repair protein RecN n=1 Tax=Oribacterium sp. WCC10 TaxID=1855343 RepID=UPI0008E3C654|nr:DNA repair protein RecN [Oribacterium sp. WCC10]SFG21094.1 DNA repair protein RecN (Recombination protein N) [Oribacterium sp. WCC10]